MLLLLLLLWLQSDSSSCETFGPVHCSAHVDVFTHDLVGMGFVVLVLSHATKTFPIVLNAVIAEVVMVDVDAVIVIVIILETCFVSRSATVIVVVQKIAFVHHAAADHVRVLSRERRKGSIALGGGGTAVGIGGQGRSSSRGGR